MGRSEYSGRMRIGIYARISVEHRGRRDSSIENQIALARHFLQGKPDLEEGGCFTDSGYSGQSFHRPGFEQLLGQLRSGALEGILVKDLSRLGRNYLETGEYLERIFPCMGVRVISLAEAYDSYGRQPGGLEYGMRNLMNEWYAKDIGRKVRLAKERQRAEGNYLGSRPPYGYRIIWIEGIRRLAPDKQVFWVREEICRQHDRGRSCQAISEWLWDRDILPPDQYKRWGRACWSRDLPEEKKRWDRGTIARISHTRGDNYPA